MVRFTSEVLETNPSSTTYSYALILCLNLAKLAPMEKKALDTLEQLDEMATDIALIDPQLDRLTEEMELQKAAIERLENRIRVQQTWGVRAVIIVIGLLGLIAWQVS